MLEKDFRVFVRILFSDGILNLVHMVKKERLALVLYMTCFDRTLSNKFREFYVPLLFWKFCIFLKNH